MTFAQRTLALIVAVVLLAPLCSAAQTNTKNVPTIREGALIKAQGSSKVYVVQGGERHWIPDPQTLRSKWPGAKVLTLPDKDVDAIPLGSPIPSVGSPAEVKPKEGALMRPQGSSKVYVVQGGERHWIPDLQTLHSKWPGAEVLNLPVKDVDAIPLGSPIPSVGSPAEVKPKEGDLIRPQGSTKVYVVQGGERHWIPDPPTLHSKWPGAKVLNLPVKDVDAIPLGSPIPSVVEKH